MIIINREMCYNSTSAWLRHQIDSYKTDMQNATVEFFLAEKKLNMTPNCIHAANHFNTVCMNLAHLAERNGDDISYVNALKKNYSRMMLLQKSSSNCQFQTVTYSYARQCLTLICSYYSVTGEEEKVTQFRSHFVHNIAK